MNAISNMSFSRIALVAMRDSLKAFFEPLSVLATVSRLLVGLQAERDRVRAELRDHRSTIEALQLEVVALQAQLTNQLSSQIQKQQAVLKAKTAELERTLNQGAKAQAEPRVSFEGVQVYYSDMHEISRYHVGSSSTGHTTFVSVEVGAGKPIPLAIKELLPLRPLLKKVTEG